MADTDRTVLHVPEHFRDFLYKLRDIDVRPEHRNAFRLLAGEVWRTPRGIVDLSLTFTFSVHRLKGVAAFLAHLSSGHPRDDESQAIADTARELAGQVHEAAGTSAVDRLGGLAR